MTTQTHSGSPCSPAFGRRGLFVGSGHRSELDDNAPGSSTEGRVVDRYLYDPYGRVTFLKPDWSPQEVTGHDDGTASAFGNEILFTGYRYNPTPGSGTYQARNREYHPTLGRFMQRDPLGYVDGGNLVRDHHFAIISTYLYKGKIRNDTFHPYAFYWPYQTS